MGETAYKVDFGLGAYKDEGCPDGEFPFCLQCPLIMCKYEAEENNTKGRTATNPRDRYPHVWGMVRAGMEVKDIAEQTGLSKKTVYRVRDGHQ